MVDQSRSTVDATRRDAILAGSAAVGTGSVAGCLGAESAPSTDAPAKTAQGRTDPSPRPRQRGDGVSLQAVQAAADGMVVPASTGQGLGDAIDPERTETPVQDAIDLINDAERGDDRGFVYMPPGTIDEGEPITDLGGIQIRGFGKAASSIRFPNDTDGIQLTPDDSFCGLKHLRLEGPKSGNSGSAIHILDEGGAVREFNIDQILMVNWQSDAPVIHTESKYYASTWGKVKIWGCNGTLCQFDTIGPANTWELAALNGMTGTNQLIKGRWRGEIGAINCGGVGRGNNGPYFDFRTGTSGRIGWVNLEVHNETKPRKSLFRFHNGGVDIGYVEVKANTVADYLVQDDRGGGQTKLGRVRVRNDGIRENVIGVTEDHNAPMIYRGPSDDVDNLTGSSLSGGVACLGDFEIVTDPQ